MGAPIKVILSREDIQKKIERIAFEILENNLEEEVIILAGIQDRGNIVADKIKMVLENISKFKIISIEVSLDKRNPLDVSLSRTFNFTNMVIILVDDVVNHGRTMFYAIKPFLEQLPRKIQTAVLIDRQHKDFPLRIDYSGYSISTTLQNSILVQIDGKNIIKAYLE